ncbi:speckle-type POZ protein-like [Planococcus citri]|uniref:speckle-type POZ protein-like n=1 Tax=Planococcus citri TaxID=170843 RepID=UPI0031F8AFF5
MTLPNMKIIDTSSYSTTVCRTEVHPRIVDYVWVIDSYRRIHDKRCVILKSSAFSAPGDEFKWRLLLNPNYCSDYVSLHLCPADTSNLAKYCPISGNLTLSLIKKSSKSEETSTQNMEFTISNSSFSVGFEYFVRRNNLLVEANELLPNDQLTVVCRLSYIKNTDVVHITNPSFINSCEKSQPACLGGIETLFMDDKFSDITLCVKNKKYVAHKNILAARCPYFQKMFDAEWIEKKLDSVELKQVDEIVFEEILRYIYAGKSEKLETMVAQLLEAADMFDLDELKLVCEQELMKSLSTETAVDVLILADRYDAKNLKTRAINYIKVNSYNPDMLSAEIKNELVKSNPRLLLEIVNALAKVSLTEIQV